MAISYHRYFHIGNGGDLLWRKFLIRIIIRLNLDYFIKQENTYLSSSFLYSRSSWYVQPGSWLCTQTWHSWHRVIQLSGSREKHLLILRGTIWWHSNFSCSPHFWHSCSSRSKTKCWCFTLTSVAMISIFISVFTEFKLCYWLLNSIKFTI